MFKVKSLMPNITFSEQPSSWTRRTTWRQTVLWCPLAAVTSEPTTMEKAAPVPSDHSSGFTRSPSQGPFQAPSRRGPWWAAVPLHGVGVRLHHHGVSHWTTDVTDGSPVRLLDGPGTWAWDLKGYFKVRSGLLCGSTWEPAAG